MLAGATLLVACSRAPTGRDQAAPAPARSELFVDGAAATGLDFVHFNGMSGEFFMAEIISPGAALVDYDNDGDLDVYLPQGAMLGVGKTLADANFPPADPRRLSDRLFRNELIPAPGAGATGALRFEDVTEASGLDGMTRYGVGAAVADYDNDGWLDIYVTNLGPNQLLRNNGDSTFTDVTDTAGVGDPGWSVPAGFLDFDNDGWLDLFVGNYVEFPFDDPILCRDLTGARDYCGPASYPAQADRLYRNRGDGTFEDVTAAAGLGARPRPALGVVIADLNGDNLSDIYVANDGEPNHFWVNQGDGTFVDEALLAGCAVNAEGKAEGSMGVDAADFDRDGDLDLFMTHLVAETNTVFVNDGEGLFTDRTSAMGLGAPSRLHTSFGTAWLDFDNDGWLDIVVANGAVKKIEALARVNDPFPVHEPNQLFRNLGDGSGRYEEVTAAAGAAFELSEVSRGAAIGDIDNDGDPDILIANNGGPARLLLNQVGSRSHWLGLEPEFDARGRIMPDTRTALLYRGEPGPWSRVRIDGSYASANDPRIIFGLGPDSNAPEILELEGVLVAWPDGTLEKWTGVPIDTYTTVRRGEGELLAP